MQVILYLKYILLNIEIVLFFKLLSSFSYFLSFEAISLHIFEVHCSGRQFSAKVKGHDFLMSIENIYMAQAN